MEVIMILNMLIIRCLNLLQKFTQLILIDQFLQLHLINSINCDNWQHSPPFNLIRQREDIELSPVELIEQILVFVEVINHADHRSLFFLERLRRELETFGVDLRVLHVAEVLVLQMSGVHLEQLESVVAHHLVAYIGELVHPLESHGHPADFLRLAV